MPQEYIDAVHKMAKRQNLHPSKVVSGLIAEALPKLERAKLPNHAGPGRPAKPKKESETK